MATAFLIDEMKAAVRGVSRAKAFYAAAVLTLAVGMTGATLMFTLIRGILLRPLPVPEEERLVVSWRVPPTGLATHLPYRASDVESIVREGQSFAAAAGVGYNGVWEQTWEDGARILLVRTAVVMGEFFKVVGVTPAAGRTLTRDHDRSTAEKAIVLSFGAWQRLFGGAQDIVGRSLVARSQAYTIVGVMPADFEYPRGVEIWTTPMALSAGESNPAYRAGLLRDVELIARLHPGVTLEQATSELVNLTSRLDQAQTASTLVNFRPVVRPYKDMVIGDIDRPLVVLFAAVGLILVIAAANVANLLLMRAETRRGEQALRTALGASRGRLVMGHVAESLVVALGAGGVGLLLSHWSLQTVTLLVPDGLPRLASIRTDAVVFAFVAGVTFLSAALAGLIPALASSQIDMVAQLRGVGRGSLGRASARGRRLLVSAQVALAVTVVAAAGLLGRSLHRLQNVDMGITTDRLVFAELDPPRQRFSDDNVRRQFFEDVTSRLNTIPGIDGVTPLNLQPFAGSLGWDVPRFTAEGQTADDVAQNPALNFEAVYEPYFRTLGVTIVRGRAFNAEDRAGTPRVAIVSEAVASATWPGLDPIGKRLKYGAVDSRNAWLTVVGVAGNTRYRELSIPRPTLYIPAAQFMNSAGRLAVRTTATPAFVAGVVRDTVRTVDPSVRVTRIATYADYLSVPLAWPRFNTVLLGVFAATALLLSSIGLYGVLAASVRQRNAEIGVRVALGATARDVLWMVLVEGLRLAVGGAVAGLALAWAATDLLRGLLFEAESLDPVPLAGAAVALVAASLVAAWLPARRAARVDPVEMLRAE